MWKFWCAKTTAPGQFYSSACVSNSANTAVTSTVAPCTIAQSAISGIYMKSLCVSGTFLSKGSDAVLGACNYPAVGTQYTVSVCVGGSDTMIGKNSVINPCTPPSAGSFVSTTCVSGDAYSLGNMIHVSTSFGIWVLLG